jgi:uncharacterized membrane protein YdjX (TVP38/TMEM64 family)
MIDAEALVVVQPKKLPIGKIAIGIVLLAAVVVAFRMLPVGAWLRGFQSYVRGLGPIGYAVYALGYGVIGCVVPASILTLGAGAIFGPVAGSIVVAVGATLAASLSFFLARTILRHRVETWTAKNAKFHAVDRAIAHEGAKIVLLVRLAAVFPFLFMNYAFGLTGIRYNRYIIATLIGILPGTIAFVSLGAAGAEVATQRTAKTIVLVIGALVALVVSIFVARIAARAIRNAGVE